METKPCCRCSAPAAFSLALLLSTVGVKPRAQKCSKTILLCQSCISFIADRFEQMVPGPPFGFWKTHELHQKDSQPPFATIKWPAPIATISWPKRPTYGCSVRKCHYRHKLATSTTISWPRMVFFNEAISPNRVLSKDKVAESSAFQVYRGHGCCFSFGNVRTILIPIRFERLRTAPFLRSARCRSSCRCPQKIPAISSKTVCVNTARCGC